ncbi:hypothetical protein HPB51_029170 [Rhipicephalus microplus]|uniref:Uncharacterized protein n=1 Tax=Rhipicephalus microplus TaxID=6941 RepID=A0A9J6CUW3_RHIMP|nr:hypothetical protein HPB51_029170 [Rhipicephalus microplus]
MAKERRGSHAVSKNEDARLAAGTHQPAFAALPESCEVPGQVPTGFRRGSRCNVAEEKAVAAPSLALNVHRKSITLPNAEDFCELPKLSPTAPSIPMAPPQTTSRSPPKSKAGSRHDIAEVNPSSPPACVVTLPKSSTADEGEKIVGNVKLLPPKPTSPSLRDMPQQEQAPRARRGSMNELQANKLEYQATAQDQNDALGKKVVEAGDQQKLKAAPGYKQESQLFLTAPQQFAQNRNPPPLWPEKVVVQRASYDWHSELDDRQTNTWPCMLFTVAFLVGLVILLIFFLVDSTKKLASLERTTTTSPLTTPLTRKEREIIESATSALSVVPNGTESTTTTTTEVAFSAEKEEELDVSMATPTSDYEEEYQQTETSWVETSERISLYL